MQLRFLFRQYFLSCAAVFDFQAGFLPAAVLNFRKGQHPSLQVFLEMVSRYHISVDQILHGEAMEGKSTERMQFDILLDELTDAEIKILTATAQALLDARTDSEGEN